MNGKNPENKRQVRLWAIIIWLILWEIVSRIIGQEILLVSPADVFVRLMILVSDSSFWMSVQFSIVRILGGFILAFVVGTVIAVFSSKWKVLGEFVEPFVKAVKAVPVASFVILVLIWIPSSELSVVISFLMVFPIVYTNISEGINQMDRNMIEMAEVFDMNTADKIRYIYISQIIPYIRSACSVSLGVCWKAGVAAEVIGLPDKSIGENLYESKIFLDTPSLFAWTVVIICISIIFEKLFMKLIDAYISKIEHAK